MDSVSLHGTGGIFPSLTTALRLLLAATGVVLSRGGSGLLAHNTLQRQTGHQNTNRFAICMVKSIYMRNMVLGLKLVVMLRRQLLLTGNIF